EQLAGQLAIAQIQRQGRGLQLVEYPVVGIIGTDALHGLIQRWRQTGHYRSRYSQQQGGEITTHGKLPVAERLAVDDVVLSRLLEFVQAGPDYGAVLQIDHLEGNLLIAGRGGRAAVHRIGGGDATDQTEVGASGRAGAANGAGVGNASALELALGLDHAGVLATDEHHATLGRALQLDAQAVGDHVLVDSRRAFVGEVLGIHYHPGSRGAPGE